MPKYILEQEPTLNDLLEAEAPSQRRFVLEGSQNLNTTNEDGFFDRVSQDWNRRRQEVSESRELYNQGKQSLGSTVLQQFANGGLGMISETAGEGLVSGFRALPEFAQTPIKKAGEYLGMAVGEEAQQVSEGYRKLREEYPTGVRNVEAVGNILSVFPVAQGISAARQAAKPIGRGLEVTGDVVKQSGMRAAADNKSSFVQDLVSPKDTLKTREKQFGGMTENPITKNWEATPDREWQGIIEEVSQLPVKKGNSLLGNYKIIDDANIKEAQSLRMMLTKSNVAVSDDEILQSLNNVKDRLSKNSYIVGDGEKSAERIVNNALEQITKNPRNVTGLLDARQALDKQILSERPNIFDAKAEGPVNVAVREVRREINNLIAQKVPAANVTKSLQKQSRLYDALDNIAQKGATQPKTGVGRLTENVIGPLTAKNIAAKTGLTALGLGGAAVSPALTGTAATLYGLYKLAGIAPGAVRSGVGSAVRGVGRVIK